MLIGGAACDISFENNNADFRATRDLDIVLIVEALTKELYYQALLQGRDVIEGFSILRHSWLIPFKAKAWLDLNARSRRGEHVDSRDLKKHG